MRMLRMALASKMRRSITGVQRSMVVFLVLAEH
jgi:hypothetical protein